MKQSSLSDSKIVEEMLADAFADLKTGRKILQDMSEKKPTLANKIIAFTKKFSTVQKNFYTVRKKIIRVFPCPIRNLKILPKE